MAKKRPPARRATGKEPLSVTTPATPALSFERLVTAIGQAHAELAAQASRAVNASLTLRNWLIVSTSKNTSVTA